MVIDVKDTKLALYRVVAVNYSILFAIVSKLDFKIVDGIFLILHVKL